MDKEKKNQVVKGSNSNPKRHKRERERESYFVESIDWKEWGERLKEGLNIFYKFKHVWCMRRHILYIYIYIYIYVYIYYRFPDIIDMKKISRLCLDIWIWIWICI